MITVARPFRFAYEGTRVVSFSAGDTLPDEDEAARYALENGLTGTDTLDWRGATVLLIASGPSLDASDLVEPGEAHEAGEMRAIAVNDSWRLAPWADILYAADAAWWNRYEGVPGFPGQRWTCQVGTESNAAEAIRRWGLRYVPAEHKPGLGLGGTIHTGSHSGFQALNLAVMFGATRLLLLGYDYQQKGKTHWFGDHPKPLRNRSPLASFRKKMEAAAPQLLELGVEVVNCSRETSLTCFPRTSVEEALDQALRGGKSRVSDGRLRGPGRGVSKARQPDGPGVRSRRVDTGGD